MRNRRSGLSIVEVSIVGSLMSVLAVLLSQAWVDVGRTATALIGRSRLVQERDMAIAAFSSDLGGGWVGSVGHLGDKAKWRWLKWEHEENTSISGNQNLVLYYNGGTGGTTNNIVVRYTLEISDPSKPNASTYSLVRQETIGTNDPTSFIVARNVFSMNVTDVTDDSKAVNIVLCFAYGLPDKDIGGVPNPHRSLTLTCDLTAKQPSAPIATGQTSPLPWTIYHYANP